MTVKISNSDLERVLREGVPGDFMEAGIWRGGASMMMRAVLKAYGIADRRVFAADSFAGFPTPAESSPDFGFELVDAQSVGSLSASASRS